MTLTDHSSGVEGSLIWEEDQEIKANSRSDEDVIISVKTRSPEVCKDLLFELYRGELPIPADRFRIETRGNLVQLTLKKTKQDDAGHYSLIAKRISQDGSQDKFARRIHLSVDDSSGFDEGDLPVFVRRLSDLTVKVGTRTRFLVEIRSSSSPKVSWHRNDEPVESSSRFSFVHEGNFYCIDVAPVTVDDEGHWTCMVENHYGRSSCTSHLTVIVPKAYKKPEFVGELRALLTETGTVSLECKVVGVPTPLLKWFKDNKEIKAGDVFALTANPDDPTSLGTYTCEAVNCMGTTFSSSRVHVVGKGSREGSLRPADTLTPSGPLPIFKQILQDESCKIGESLFLSCKVQVPPWPKEITWYNKEGKVESNEKYRILEDGLGGYSIEVNPVEAMDEGEWKCVATSTENMKQFTTCYVAMSIPKNYRKPRFMESLKAILTEEGLVSFECKVVGFPTPLLQWFKDGQELKPGDVYQLTGTNSLGSYCCIARNCMGEAKSTAELTVEDIQNQLNEEERLQLLTTNQPPKFIKGLRSCEARINDNFRFSVQVSIAPEPSLFWYRDDTPVDENDKYTIERETVGTCHLEVQRLEFVDQAEWKCVASNDFGHSVTSCFLKLIIPKHFKKPKFLENLRAILSEEGAVNLECKVIGVPQPTLKWYKDGAELKPGDIHRIISGQDGTCCLGTYTCEATNCMGSVSSSASLLGFEDRVTTSTGTMDTSLPFSTLEHERELARNLSLSTIHEERTSQLHDTAQTDQSVTVDDRGEVSFSFDGKEVSVSLYETPDLTEEEAIQIVEMYADQLSEHVTEHSMIELPPMRFVKETSTSGNLLMEAVVIDLSPDYFVTVEEGDDLRTEADVEDMSIMDEQASHNHSLSSPLPLESRVDISFSEGDRPPIKPPRRKSGSMISRSERSEKSDKKFQESESYHSAKEPLNGAMTTQQKDDLDMDVDVDSEAFADALSSARYRADDKFKQLGKNNSIGEKNGSSSLDAGDSSFDSAVNSGAVKKRGTKKKRSLGEKGSFEESTKEEWKRIRRSESAESDMAMKIVKSHTDVESEKSLLLSNKEVLLNNSIQLSEPALIIRDALIDFDSLLSLAERSDQEQNAFISENFVLPIENLCNQVTAIEAKALKSAGKRSMTQNIRIAILEAISGPTEELLRGIEVMKRRGSTEILKIDPVILESLVDPVDEILTGLTKIEYELSGTSRQKKPIVLERMLRTISWLGRRVEEAEVTSVLRKPLKAIYKTLDTFVKQIPLNPVSGNWTENIDAVLIESLCRPLEDLTRTSTDILNDDSSINPELAKQLAEPFEELLTRLDTLVVALEGYETDHRTKFVLALKSSLVGAAEELSKFSEECIAFEKSRSLPDVILDPLIDVQSSINLTLRVIEEPRSEEEIKISQALRSSELAMSLAELRQTLSNVAHTATTLKEEETINALTDLREPLFDLQIALSSELLLEEIPIINSVISPLNAVKIIFSTALKHVEGMEMANSITPILHMLEEIQEQIPMVVEQLTLMESRPTEESSEEKEPDRRKVLTEILESLETASELSTVFFDLSSVLEQQERNFGRSALSDSGFASRLEEVRESVGSATVALGNLPIKITLNDDDIINELAHLSTPLINLQKEINQKHDALEQKILKSVVKPIGKLKTVIENLAESIFKPEKVMLVLGLLGDIEESLRELDNKSYSLELEMETLDESKSDNLQICERGILEKAFPEDEKFELIPVTKTSEILEALCMANVAENLNLEEVEDYDKKLKNELSLEKSSLHESHEKEETTNTAITTEGLDVLNMVGENEKVIGLQKAHTEKAMRFEEAQIYEDFPEVSFQETSEVTSTTGAAKVEDSPGVLKMAEIEKTKNLEETKTITGNTDKIEINKDIQENRSTETSGVAEAPAVLGIAKVKETTGFEEANILEENMPETQNVAPNIAESPPSIENAEILKIPEVLQLAVVNEAENLDNSTAEFQKLEEYKNNEIFINEKEQEIIKLGSAAITESPELYKMAKTEGTLQLEEYTEMEGMKQNIHELKELEASENIETAQVAGKTKVLKMGNVEEVSFVEELTGLHEDNNSKQSTNKVTETPEILQRAAEQTENFDDAMIEILKENKGTMNHKLQESKDLIKNESAVMVGAPLVLQKEEVMDASEIDQLTGLIDELVTEKYSGKVTETGSMGEAVNISDVPVILKMAAAEDVSALSEEALDVNGKISDEAIMHEMQDKPEKVDILEPLEILKMAKEEQSAEYLETSADVLEGISDKSDLLSEPMENDTVSVEKSPELLNMAKSGEAIQVEEQATQIESLNEDKGIKKVDVQEVIENVEMVKMSKSDDLETFEIAESLEIEEIKDAHTVLQQSLEIEKDATVDDMKQPKVLNMAQIEETTKLDETTIMPEKLDKFAISKDIQETGSAETVNMGEAPAVFGIAEVKETLRFDEANSLTENASAVQDMTHKIFESPLSVANEILTNEKGQELIKLDSAAIVEAPDVYKIAKTEDTLQLEEEITEMEGIKQNIDKLKELEAVKNTETIQVSGKPKVLKMGEIGESGGLDDSTVDLEDTDVDRNISKLNLQESKEGQETLKSSKIDITEQPKVFKMGDVEEVSVTEEVAGINEGNKSKESAKEVIEAPTQQTENFNVSVAENLKENVDIMNLKLKESEELTQTESGAIADVAQVLLKEEVKDVAEIDQLTGSINELVTEKKSVKVSEINSMEGVVEVSDAPEILKMAKAEKSTEYVDTSDVLEQITDKSDISVKELSESMEPDTVSKEKNPELLNMAKSGEAIQVEESATQIESFNEGKDIQKVDVQEVMEKSEVGALKISNSPEVFEMAETELAENLEEIEDIKYTKSDSKDSLRESDQVEEVMERAREEIQIVKKEKEEKRIESKKEEVKVQKELFTKLAQNLDGVKQQITNIVEEFEQRSVITPSLPVSQLATAIEMLRRTVLHVQLNVSDYALNMSDSSAESLSTKVLCEKEKLVADLMELLDPLIKVSEALSATQEYGTPELRLLNRLNQPIQNIKRNVVNLIVESSLYESEGSTSYTANVLEPMVRALETIENEIPLALSEVNSRLEIVSVLHNVLRPLEVVRERMNDLDISAERTLETDVANILVGPTNYFTQILGDLLKQFEGSDHSEEQIRDAVLNLHHLVEPLFEFHSSLSVVRSSRRSSVVETALLEERKNVILRSVEGLNNALAEIIESVRTKHGGGKNVEALLDSLITLNAAMASVQKHVCKAEYSRRTSCISTLQARITFSLNQLADAVATLEDQLDQQTRDIVSNPLETLRKQLQITQTQLNQTLDHHLDEEAIVEGFLYPANRLLSALNVLKESQQSGKHQITDTSLKLLQSLEKSVSEFELSLSTLHNELMNENESEQLSTVETLKAVLIPLKSIQKTINSIITRSGRDIQIIRIEASSSQQGDKQIEDKKIIDANLGEDKEQQINVDNVREQQGSEISDIGQSVPTVYTTVETIIDECIEISKRQTETLLEVAKAITTFEVEQNQQTAATEQTATLQGEESKSKNVNIQQDAMGMEHATTRPPQELAEATVEFPTKEKEEGESLKYLQEDSDKKRSPFIRSTSPERELAESFEATDQEFIRLKSRELMPTSAEAVRTEGADVYESVSPLQLDRKESVVAFWSLIDGPLEALKESIATIIDEQTGLEQAADIDLAKAKNEKALQTVVVQQLTELQTSIAAIQQITAAEADRPEEITWQEESFPALQNLARALETLGEHLPVIGSQNLTQSEELTIVDISADNSVAATLRVLVKPLQELRESLAVLVEGQVFSEQETDSAMDEILSMKHEVTEAKTVENSEKFMAVTTKSQVQRAEESETSEVEGEKLMQEENLSAEQRRKENEKGRLKEEEDEQRYKQAEEEFKKEESEHPKKKEAKQKKKEDEKERLKKAEEEQGLKQKEEERLKREEAEQKKIEDEKEYLKKEEEEQRRKQEKEELERLKREEAEQKKIEDEKERIKKEEEEQRSKQEKEELERLNREEVEQKKIEDEKERIKKEEEEQRSKQEKEKLERLKRQEAEQTKIEDEREGIKKEEEEKRQKQEEEHLKREEAEQQKIVEEKERIKKEEEEQRRKQEEEERLKREEEQKKIDEEKERIKKQEEEHRRKQEKEDRLKREEAEQKKIKDEKERLRKEKEEQRRKQEEEEHLKREEAEQKKIEDEKVLIKKEEEEQRRKQEEEERLKREEAEQKKIEDEKVRIKKEEEEQRRKQEEEDRLKQEEAEEKKIAEEKERLKKEEEKQRRKQEEEDRLKREEAEQKKIKDEKERIKKEEEEQRRKQEEEERLKRVEAEQKKIEDEKVRMKKEEEEQGRKQEEEERLKREEAEQKKINDEKEHLRREEEEQRLKQEEEERLKREEAEEKKIEIEEERIKKEEEEQRRNQEEEERLKREEAEQKKIDDEKERIKKEEEEQRRKQEEEERLKRVEAEQKKIDEEKERKAEEEEEQRRKQEEGDRLKREETEQKKIKDEKERLRKEEEEQRLKQEEEERLKREEAEQKKTEDEKVRIKKEEEEQRRKEEEERLKREEAEQNELKERLKKEKEEQRRKQEEEERLKREKEEQKKIDQGKERKKKEEEEEEKRRKQEEEARLKREESEEKKIKDEKERLRKEEEEQRLKQEEEGRLKREKAERKKIEDERVRIRKEEEEQRLKKEEEERLKREEAEQKKIEDEKVRIKKEEAEQKRIQEEEKLDRLKREEAEQKKIEVENERLKKEKEEQRREQEEEDRLNREDAEQKKIEDENERRKNEDEEQKRKQQEDELERIKREETEQKNTEDETERIRKEVEEHRRIQEEEELGSLKHKEAEQKKIEDEKERLKTEEEQTCKEEEEESGRSKQQKAEQRKKEDEKERLKKEEEQKRKQEEEQLKKEELERIKREEAEQKKIKDERERLKKEKKEQRRKQKEEQLKKGELVSLKQEEVVPQEGIEEEGKNKEEKGDLIIEEDLSKKHATHLQQIAEENKIVGTNEKGRRRSKNNDQEKQNNEIKVSGNLHTENGEGIGIVNRKLSEGKEDNLLKRTSKTQADILNRKTSDQLVKTSEECLKETRRKRSIESYSGKADVCQSRNKKFEIEREIGTTRYSRRDVKSEIERTLPSREPMKRRGSQSDDSSYTDTSSLSRGYKTEDTSFNQRYRRDQVRYPKADVSFSDSSSKTSSSNYPEYIATVSSRNRSTDYSSTYPTFDALQRNNKSYDRSCDVSRNNYESSYSTSSSFLRPEDSRSALMSPSINYSRRIPGCTSPSLIPEIDSSAYYLSTRTSLTPEKSSVNRAKCPFFCTKLTNRTVAEGSRLKLTCTVIGQPDPEVHWTKNGEKLRPGGRERIKLENGLATLEINSVLPEDSGYYVCIANNSHGQSSSEAVVRVYAAFETIPLPPTFTSSIKDAYRFADHELVLECRVRGQPTPSVTWLKDDIVLRGSRYTQSFIGDGICRLQIADPNPSDSGEYTCRADNDVRTDQIRHVVHFEGHEHRFASARERILFDDRNRTPCREIGRRPLFSSYLMDYSVPAGGTIALQVEVGGTPAPNVTWLRRDGDKKERISSSKIRTFAESGVHTLILPEASVSEAGTYVCRASNAYGQIDTSANVEVIAPSKFDANEKPAMFISRPVDKIISAVAGEDVSVSFRVSGVPKPQVTWMKGIRDITNGPRSYKDTVDDYVRIMLSRIIPSDEGTYCIQAKNRYGCDRAFFTIKVKQRARSLTPTILTDTGNRLADIQNQEIRSHLKDVPGPISSEPIVVDGGRNWLSLSWGKAEQRGPAPVVGYKIDAWLLGRDGGARWVELGVSPINLFDAFNLRSGGEYKFRITPRNRYGWGESVTSTDSFTVSEIVEIPEFSKFLPGQLKALEGSTIKLECEVRGDSKINWYREKTGIDPNEDPRCTVYHNGFKCSLTLTNIKETDSGRFICEATNKAGKVSTFARVMVVNDPKILKADEKLRSRYFEGTSVEGPPQFTMRLRDRRVQATYPVRLTCQVLGYPEPEVMWFKNGKEICEDGFHAIWNDESHFYTLEISCSSIEDSGCYMAKARNVNGSVSCRCVVVVDKGIRAYIAPEFLCGLDAAYTIKIGGELRMCAQIEAYPSVGVVWHRDGIRLRPSRRAVMTLNYDGAVELSLANVTNRDAGIYSCTATNEVGRAETSTRVAVLGAEEADSLEKSLFHVTIDPPLNPGVPYSQKPLFVTKPLSTEAVEGDTVIIMCEVVGDPKPEVMWLRDFLKPDYYRDAAHFRRIGASPQYRLEIPFAKLDFTGTYSVIAKNCHGEAKAIISLQIYAKGQGKGDNMDHQSSVRHGKVLSLPVIRKELRDLRCCDGDAVTLECKVYAPSETPNIRWEKEGKTLPLTGDFSADFDGEIARLSIQHVYPEDEGEYTCIASNELGKAFTSACLIVDVPEGKENVLSQPRLSKPMGLLSAGSTPRSTPRSTPVRSLSPAVARGRELRAISLPRRAEACGSMRKRPKITPPKFYTVPHNRVAEEGETVRFQCAITGHPMPWVVWDKDGITVTPTARISIKEKDDLRVLEITQVTSEDVGLYRVTLENDVGRTESTARLEIINRHSLLPRPIRTRSASPRTYPTFTRSLLGCATRVNSRFQLQCDIRSSPSPTPSWYRNGKRIERSNRVRKYFDGRTAGIEISEVKKIDAGEYVCEAINLLGSTRSSCQVIVLDPEDISTLDEEAPKFLQTLPKESIVMEGHSYELQARITGTPPFEIKWLKDKNQVCDTDCYRYVVYEDGGVALRLANVNSLDAGEYTCLVRNAFGTSSSNGLFAVQDYKGASKAAFWFTKTPVPVLASKGETVSFCARIHSERPIEIEWSVNGKSARENYRCKVEKDGPTTILRINSVTYRDCGEIRCTASVTGGRGPSISSATDLRFIRFSGAGDRSSSPTKKTTLSPMVKRSTRVSTSPYRQENKENVNEISAVNLRADDMKTRFKKSNVSQRLLISCADVFSTKSMTQNQSLHLGNGEREKENTIIRQDVPEKSKSNINESLQIENQTPKKTEEENEVMGKSVESSMKNESFIDDNKGSASIDEKSIGEKSQIPKESRSSSLSSDIKVREETECLDEYECDEPAVVLQDPSDIIALRGSTVVLSVSYRGQPEPRVRWLQAGRVLIPGDKIRIKIEKGTSSLTLESITADQAGKYAVFVENILGQDCRYSSVAVEGPPEPPAGTPIVSSCNVGSDIPSVNVAWCSPSYDGGCALTGYSIEMRKVDEESWTLVSETYHSLSHTVAGLVPDETYLFRVRAINIHGASEPSIESAPFTVLRKMENVEEEEIKDQMSNKEDEDESFCEKNMEDSEVTPEDGQIFAEQYEVLEELGKGRYGIVKRVIEKSTGRSFASKFVRTIKASDRKQVREEMKIMNMLRHPKLLRLAAAFESPREIIMITEYISGGELFERVVADDFTLTEKDSILFMRQICDGVKYMHKNSVVHLDLKPENIMCRKRTSHNIKLIDFGLAQILQPNVPIRVLFGTPEFIPPEIISYEPIGTESDMWSVGVICYVLLSGLSPFMGNNDTETFANITRADYDFDDEAFDAISQDAKDFIGCLLIKRKESRMTAKECLEHSWLAQHTENMSRVALSTEKLKKFLVRRKWQKTGNALRALGRMSRSANNRRSPSLSSASSPVLKETSSFDSSQDEQNSSTRENSFDENVDIVPSISDETFEQKEDKPIEKKLERTLEKSSESHPSDNFSTEEAAEVFSTSVGEDNGLSILKYHSKATSDIKIDQDGKNMPQDNLESKETFCEEKVTFEFPENVAEESHLEKKADNETQSTQKYQVRFSVDLKKSDVSSVKQEYDDIFNLHTMKLSNEIEDNQGEVVSGEQKQIATGLSEDDVDFKNGVCNTACDANPLHEADDGEGTRIIKTSQGRRYLHTGNVSRTARIFEKKEAKSSAGNAVEEKPVPLRRKPSSLPISRTNTQSERIQKAFAFWNK